MDRNIKILLFIIVALFLYWCYIKYNEKKILRKLSQFIKNNITITQYNMNQFINLSTDIKKILLNIAIKYKHDDIINILTNN